MSIRFTCLVQAILLATVSLFPNDSQAQTIPNWLPSSGLVGYYPFDGNAGDSSGNQLHGSLMGGLSFTTGRNGQPNGAASFNGTSTYVEVQDDPKLRFRRGTIIYWIKTTSTARQQIITKSNFNSSNEEMYAAAINNPSSGFVMFGVKNNSNCFAGQGWRLVQNNVNVNNGQWQMVTFTFSDSLKIFKNGTLISSTVSNNSLIDSCIGGNLRIGRNWVSDNRYFTGELDDVILYNRALSQQEILNIYTGCGTSQNVILNPINTQGLSNTVVKFYTKAIENSSTFQWQINNGLGFSDISNFGPYLGVTNDTLSVITNQTLDNAGFRCIVTLPGCRRDTTSTAILTVWGVKTSEIELENIKYLFSNPVTTNRIIIQVDNKSHEFNELSYQVIDLAGKLINSGSISNGLNQLQLNPTLNGVYLLRIMNGTNLISSKKLIFNL